VPLSKLPKVRVFIFLLAVIVLLVTFDSHLALFSVVCLLLEVPSNFPFDCLGECIKSFKKVKGKKAPSDGRPAPPPIITGIPLPYVQIHRRCTPTKNASGEDVDDDDKPPPLASRVSSVDDDDDDDSSSSEEEDADDPEGTLYPMSELPAHVKAKIKNTRNDGKLSPHVWATCWFAFVMHHLNNKKGKHCQKMLPFTLAAIHPSSPQYHAFHQDYIFGKGGKPTIPNGRGHYLKAKGKQQADVFIEYTWDVESNCYKGKIVWEREGAEGKFTMHN